jgi:flagellar protein FlaG
MGMVIAPAGFVGLPGKPIPENQMIRAGDRRGSPPAVDRGTAKKAPAPGREILSITRDLEQISLSFNRKLQFMVDHESHEISVKVIDRATDKVIKVLPPEELQRLHSRIEETIGFLFDETV